MVPTTVPSSSISKAAPYTALKGKGCNGLSLFSARIQFPTKQTKTLLTSTNELVTAATVHILESLRRTALNGARGVRVFHYFCWGFYYNAFLKYSLGLRGPQIHENSWELPSRQLYESQGPYTGRYTAPPPFAAKRTAQVRLPQESLAHRLKWTIMD